MMACKNIKVEEKRRTDPLEGVLTSATSLFSLSFRSFLLNASEATTMEARKTRSENDRTQKRTQNILLDSRYILSICSSDKPRVSGTKKYLRRLPTKTSATTERKRESKRDIRKDETPNTGASPYEKDLDSKIRSLHAIDARR